MLAKQNLSKNSILIVCIYDWDISYAIAKFQLKF